MEKIKLLRRDKWCNGLQKQCVVDSDGIDFLEKGKRINTKYYILELLKRKIVKNRFFKMKKFKSTCSK